MPLFRQTNRQIDKQFREREREREGGRKRERERERELSWHKLN